jgi:hypothetical protein
MGSEGAFRTESLDLAAFLVTAGHELHIYRNPYERRAIFEFKESENLLKTIVNYEGGSPLPAKRLLNVRSRLFREASQVVKGGTGS